MTNKHGKDCSIHCEVPPETATKITNMRTLYKTRPDIHLFYAETAIFIKKNSRLTGPAGCHARFYPLQPRQIILDTFAAARSKVSAGLFPYSGAQTCQKIAAPAKKPKKRPSCP